MKDKNKKETDEQVIENQGEELTGVEEEVESQEVSETNEDKSSESVEKTDEDKGNTEAENAEEDDDNDDDDDDDDDDEMLSRTKKSVVSTIITIAFALIAVAALGFAYFSGAFNPDEEGRYNATETEKQQIMAEAKVLLTNNYETIRLFYQEGLAHEAPSAYDGNTDGNYKVTDTKYTKYQQIADLVNSTFASDVAATMLEYGQGSGKLYQDVDGVLKMNINNFEPQDYNKDWTNLKYECIYIDTTNVKVEVTLTATTPQVKDDGTTSEIESTVVLSGSMVKTENGWRLKNVIY